MNIKPGIRFGWGNPVGPANWQRHSVYAGFGFPITDQELYSNIFRLEYRVMF